MKRLGVLWQCVFAVVLGGGALVFAIFLLALLLLGQEGVVKRLGELTSR